MCRPNTLEKSLNGRLNAMSTNLHVALRAHSRQAHEDVALALLENARLSVGFHKHVLRELEAVRPEVARIGKLGSSAQINGKAAAQATYGNAPYPNAGGEGYGDGPLGMPQQHQQQPSMVPSRPYNSPPPAIWSLIRPQSATTVSADPTSPTVGIPSQQCLPVDVPPIATGESASVSTRFRRAARRWTSFGRQAGGPLGRR